MSKTYKEYSPNQVYLIPPCPQDWLPKNRLVYFISDLVDNLDLSFIHKVSADTGYFSETNLEWVRRKTNTHIPGEKVKHHNQPEPAPRGRIPVDMALPDLMKRKLRTKAGRAKYALRKQIVEPVFGQIKEARRFRRFLLRGLDFVRGEWLLVCLTHNILKQFVSKNKPSSDAFSRLWYAGAPYHLTVPCFLARPESNIGTAS